jgi:hypothetical protein
MAFTMQEVVDKGRAPLNDDDKVRYPDTELLGFANDGILYLRNRRPDLFIGSYATLPEKLVIGDTFPLSAEYVPAVADYIAARAESRNDESVLTERAQMFFTLASGQI